MEENERNERTKGKKRGPLLCWAVATAACLLVVAVAAVLCTMPLQPDRAMPVGIPSLEEWVQQPLDLNIATEKQLCQLPGIGEAKAQAILEYRAQNGPFTSVEQLLRVPGISQKTLERFADQVAIK